VLGVGSGQMFVQEETCLFVDINLYPKDYLALEAFGDLFYA